MELKFHDTYKTVPTYIVWVNIGNGISFIIGYYSKNDRSRHSYRNMRKSMIK